MTKETEDLKTRMTNAEDNKDTVLDGTTRNLFNSFGEQSAIYLFIYLFIYLLVFLFGMMLLIAYLFLMSLFPWQPIVQGTSVCVFLK